jgi:hypothetical protein
MLSSGNEALEYERTFAWLSGPFVLQGQVLPNFQVKIFNLKVRKHNYSALVFFRTFGLTTIKSRVGSPCRVGIHRVH